MCDQKGVTNGLLKDKVSFGRKKESVMPMQADIIPSCIATRPLPPLGFALGFVLALPFAFVLAAGLAASAVAAFAAERWRNLQFLPFVQSPCM